MTEKDHASAYDFVQLGEKLADAFVKAAEEQVTKAQTFLDQTRSMADIVRSQCAAQVKEIEEMTGRFKEFGDQMITAHRKLNGDEPIPSPIPSLPLLKPDAFNVKEIVKLRALAQHAREEASEHGRNE